MFLLKPIKDLPKTLLKSIDSNWAKPSPTIEYPFNKGLPDYLSLQHPQRD